MKQTPVCTLNSLSPDGGIVPLVDFVITKVNQQSSALFCKWLSMLQMFPIAFLEFIDENGKQRRRGPRKEPEEQRAHDRWLVSEGLYMNGTR